MLLGFSCESKLEERSFISENEDLVNYTNSENEFILKSDTTEYDKKKFGSFQNNSICKEGKKAAKIDISNGIYLINEFGLRYIDANYEKFRNQYFMKKFNIKIKARGCVITGFDLCYDSLVTSEINKKFGDNFYQIKEKEIQKNFNNILDSLINSNFVFVSPKKYAVLNSDSIDIKDYLVNKFGKPKETLIFSFIVEKNGNISNINFIESNSLELNYKFLNEINKLSYLIPARVKDKPVRSEIKIYFYN